jgi:hypothetical protein
MEQRMDGEIRDAVIRAAAEVVVEYQMQKTKAQEEASVMANESSSSEQPKGVTTRESATSVSSFPESSARANVSALLSMPGYESSEATRLAIQVMLDERDRMEDKLRIDLRGLLEVRKQQEIEFLNTVQQHIQSRRDDGVAVGADVQESATQLIMETQNQLNEMRLLFQKFVSSLCFSEDRFLEKVNDVSRRLDGSRSGEAVGADGGHMIGAAGGVGGGSEVKQKSITEKKLPEAKSGGLMSLIAMCGGNHR